MSHLYVYIKTPPINNTSTVAHVVEHCAINRDNLAIKDFFRFCDIKGETYIGYTRYDLYSDFDVEQFLQHICSPMDKKVFQRELLAFQEETREQLFTGFLKKKIEKLLNIDKPLLKGNPSRNAITQYHKKRYKRNNMVICNSEYVIIENNFTTTKAGKRSLDIIKQSTLSIDGEKNKVTILPYHHRKSQVLLYFMEFLHDTYMEYTQRHMGGIYNTPVSCMMELTKYVCIAIPQSTKIDISDEFLYAAKKHFCDVALDEYARKIEITNLLYIGQLPSDNEVKEFVRSIDRKLVKKIIE